VSVLGTASAKPAAEATADFDSLLHLSKGMSVDQIRHKGRSVFLEQKDPHTALLWYRTALKRPTDNFTAEKDYIYIESPVPPTLLAHPPAGVFHAVYFF
jgi:hypothetical protein